MDLEELQLICPGGTLPNRTSIRYNQYVIPCCDNCNRILSQELEDPISRSFSGGSEPFHAFLENDGIRLFCWLALIFIKSHLKDQTLAFTRDARAQTGTIASELEYNWVLMHHTYCLARACYTKATIDASCIGSLLVVPIKDEMTRDPFDWIDLTDASTMGIRIHDIGLIAVFDDAGAVNSALDPLLLENLNVPVNGAQFRELIAHFGCCRLHLKNPPRFATIRPCKTNDSVAIVCAQKDTRSEFEEGVRSLLGDMMHRVLYEYAKNNVEVDQFEEKLLAGQFSFLRIPQKSVF